VVAKSNTYLDLYIALNVSEFIRDLAFSSLPYAFSARAGHAAFNDGLARSASSTNATALAVSRRQLRVRSGGDARIGYAALVLRSTLEVDRALPSAVLSTHRSR